MLNIHRSPTVILPEPWHRRSCEISNFQNGKLFTFVDSTINDRRLFLKCLVRSSQTRSWDGKLTVRNFSVTEQDVIVCFVRINAFYASNDVNDNKQLFEFKTCKFCETLLKSCTQVRIMTKRNRNIKNIFIILQRGANGESCQDTNTKLYWKCVV